MRSIRIGSGAGYSGDRIEPAVELAEKGDIRYLVFECLGERTVALAQRARLKNPDDGFDPLLEARMRAVLRVALDCGCFRLEDCAALLDAGPVDGRSPCTMPAAARRDVPSPATNTAAPEATHSTSRAAITVS